MAEQRLDCGAATASCRVARSAGLQLFATVRLGDGTLAFEPCNEDHAIMEAVFAVVGLGQFTYDDRSSVKAAHSKWEALLPRLQEGGVLNIAVAAPGADVPPPPISPLSFARFRADGEVEWQLMLNADALAVKCGAYTRWQDVWTIVRDLLTGVTEALPSREQKVRAVSLQYLDAFRWIGDDPYDARNLLRDDDPVPPSIFQRGPIWHLGQGWFVDAQEPVAGRVLQRMHIGSTAEGDQHQAQFTTYVRFDLRDTPDLQGAFAEPNPPIDSLFSCIHRYSKTLLADFLAPEMAQRINLDVDER